MMQKLRRPESIEDAVAQAVAFVGAAAICTELTAIGLRASPSLIAKWGDPDNDTHHIGLRQALAIDALLIKAGHGAVFGELFAALLPAEPQPDDGDPVRATMRITTDAANLMDRTAQAMKDRQLEHPEIAQLRAKTESLQKALAKFRRCLVWRPGARGGGK